MSACCIRVTASPWSPVRKVSYTVGVVAARVACGVTNILAEGAGVAVASLPVAGVLWGFGDTASNAAICAGDTVGSPLGAAVGVGATTGVAVGALEDAAGIKSGHWKNGAFPCIIRKPPKVPNIKTIRSGKSHRLFLFFCASRCAAGSCGKRRTVLGA